MAFLLMIGMPALVGAAISPASAPWAAPRAAMRSGPVAKTDVDALARAIAAMNKADYPTLSPDGRHVAFVSNASGMSQVWIVPRGGGAPVRLTNARDPVGLVHWSPKGDRIAYTVLPGGSNAAQIYVIGVDGKGDRRLTNVAGQTHDLDGWTTDGRLRMASTSPQHPAAFQPMLLDPNSGAIEKVGSARALSSFSDVSADGRWALVSRVEKWEESEVWLVDARTGEERSLTAAFDPGSYWAAAIARDGREAWITGTINGSDREVLGRIRLDGRGRAGPVEIVAARTDAELQSASFDASRTCALLVWNVSGRSEVEWLDTGSGKRTPGPALPVDVVRTLRIDEQGAVFAGMGAARPDDIYKIDRKTNQVTQLTHSRHDGIDLSALVRPTLLEYKARDGLPLSGWLYRPASFTAPGPVVELYHGGPEDQARPKLDVYVQALVASGIAVFAPNVRGSTGYGRRFMQLDNGPARAQAITDIADTTATLVTTGIADSSRVGILGASYGGYMALAGITTFPKMFSAAVDIYGVSDLESMFRTMQPWVHALAGAEYGDPIEQVSLLRELSPLNRIERATTPLLMLHGANDRNVPISESERVLSRMQAFKRDVMLLRFPNAGHGFDRIEERIRAADAVSTFFSDKLMQRSASLRPADRGTRQSGTRRAAEANR